MARTGSRGGIAVALVAAFPLAARADADPGLNMLGMPGLIDMPSALSRPDSSFSLGLAGFRNTLRYALSWQISPHLAAAFRYAMLYDLHGTPVDPILYPAIFDRSFSLHYRFNDEGPALPAFAIGLNDVIGTGVQAGEYLVGTKTLMPGLRATAGIGWGRLGSHGSFANPLDAFGPGWDTRSYDRPAEGGTFTPASWFHGPAALFGGIAAHVSPRLSLTAEYSSDAYQREAGSAFHWAAPWNLGLTYAVSPSLRLSAYALYGAELGAQLTWTFNPKTPRSGSGYDPAGPVMHPTNQPGLPAALPPDRLAQDLADQGLRLLGLGRAGDTLQVQIANDRYATPAQALGRAVRVLSLDSPPNVAFFAVTLTEGGMPISTTLIDRDATATAEFGVAPAPVPVIMDAPQGVTPRPGATPHATFRLGPYLEPSFFDPDAPLRADLGLLGRVSVDLAPGLVLSASLQQKLAGTLDQISRPPQSSLPHVRTDAALYFKGGDTTIPSATLAWTLRPGRNLYARATAGLLEPMFAGLSTEVLWKPQAGRLALGAELDHVWQRGYDQLLDLRAYQVTTGHLSAYLDLGRNVTARLDMGQYLAGDRGATLTLAKRLDNGWQIAVFATRTDVPAAAFGEGSFDKGLSLTIPLQLAGGRPRREVSTTVLHALQRDGGAMLEVPGRLYDLIRDDQARALDASWGRFWK